jgi:DUF438 domain-containing protein
MANTYHSSNKWALAGLFKRIKLGDDPKQLCSEACHLADKVNSEDIEAAQQVLMNEGCSSQMVQKISAVFLLMGLRRKNKTAEEPEPSNNHILERIFAEHTMLRCYLSDLKQISEQILATEDLNDVSSEFRRLSRIVEYLVLVKKQIAREDDLIFPYLKKVGWAGLSEPSEEEHRVIKAEIDNLTALVTGFDAIGLDDFKAWLPLVVKRFCPLMLNHLLYEQETLWPICLVIIDDAKAWNAMKALSDEFDY